jgi:hypothetical protein
VAVEFIEEVPRSASGKAQADRESAVRLRRMSIYRRPDEHFNVHTNRCEIPLILAGQRSH